MKIRFQKPSALFSMVLMIAFLAGGFAGCTATLEQKRVTLGLADWYVTNDTLLRADYENASPEHAAWLWDNVLPYMNLMKYGVIGLNAVQQDKMNDLAFAVDGLANLADVPFDAGSLINAIKDKDYYGIEIELLLLKNVIIKKWLGE